MNIKIITLVCALALSLPGHAQKTGKRTKAKKNVAPVIVEDPGVLLYKSMVPSTAKVLFIDSIVVDKKNFLANLPVCPEAGRLAMRDIEYSQYQNEFGDRAFFAAGDSAISTLYAVDKVGNEWSTPTRLFQTIEGIDKVNYPYLMSDGITLYFGAKGPGTMGGYDIYMTTFDYENGKFYSPENIGLPYNSTSNDYMLAIDDINKLGWLVTDRRQPADKVCIYTFVPSESRQGFDDTDLNNEEIEKYSMIMSIADTWKFGNRKAARARLNELKNELKSKRNEDNDNERFVITDNIVYRSANDFKSEQAKEMYMRLKIQRKELYDNMERLSSMRRLYHESGTTMRSTLKTDLLSLEKTVEDMYAEIHKQEKAIRKTEYNLLNNH